MRLEDWFIGWDKHDGYRAPEERMKCVIGRVYGHATFADGSDVKLGMAALTKSEGRVITTTAGEVYELGRPEPAYREWLRTAGIPYDDANPVKLVAAYQYPSLSAKRPKGGGRASS